MHSNQNEVRGASKQYVDGKKMLEILRRKFSIVSQEATTTLMAWRMECRMISLIINHCCLVAKSCLTLCDPMDSNARLFCPWDSLGKNTGVGCHFLLRGLFLTQVSNLHLLHWQEDSWILLSHQGSPIYYQRLDFLG